MTYYFVYKEVEKEIENDKKRRDFELFFNFGLYSSFSYIFIVYSIDIKICSF